MGVFYYKGRNSQGELVQGKLDGNSSAEVAGHLHNSGITPIDVKESEDATSVVEGASKDFDFDKYFVPKVKTQDLILFCRQMYSLSKAGVPLTKGMRSLADTLSHPTLKAAIKDVASSLETGVELTNALARHPKIFSQLFISIVHVGENSGKLDGAFDQLSVYLERDDTTKKQLKKATRYPSFVMIAMVIAVVIINLKVIPAVAGMFEGFGAELPLPTRILLGISDFFVNYSHILLLVVVAVFFGVRMYLQSDDGKRQWGKAKLKLPVIGDIINRSTLSRYSRSLSMMMASGVPLMQTLDLCANTVDNPYLGRKIIKIRDGIQRGETLHQTHVMSGMFTPLILQMIHVGEESGKVEELLLEVAEFYEREVDYDLESMSDKIEPILIVIMAGMIAVLALGIFLPMWDMLGMQN